MTEFLTAMQQAGINPPSSIVADGKLHRFHIDGDRPRTENGWYVLHSDPPAGAFGCWKRDISETWSNKQYQDLSGEEKARHRANMDASKRQREEEQERIYAECQQKSKRIWECSAPAPIDHSYTVKKGLKDNYGLRLYKNSLVVPVRDSDGALHGLQFISSEGEKKFKSGTSKKGHYFSIGGKPETILYLTEGYATGATIHEATGSPVAICFDAGNLKPVAEALRNKFPDVQFVFCADNDNHTEGNPGITKATEAARSVNGLLAVPNIPTSGSGTDFNDLAAVTSLEEVRRQIMAASSPSGNNNATPTSGRLRVVRGCDIQPEPIEWLWPGWLAAGKFHVLAGAPGTGKTTIAGNLASILTQGERWPDGGRANQTDVAIWSGEDDVNDTLAPRLIAAGANMNRVHFIQGIDSGEERRTFDPATDMRDLQQYLVSHPEIKLLVVDPVVSAVSGDSHKNTEVRRNLQPLVDLGQECHCAVFGISHFSKGTSGKDPVERVTGSIAFGALARIVLATAKVEDDSAPEGTRLFARAKSNIGPDCGGWQYRLNTTELKRYPGVFTSEVLWGSQVEGSARELLAAADSVDEDGGSALEEAKNFLECELSDGPVAVRTIMAEARKAGISERTLKRAKSALKIKSEKGGLERGWQWVVSQISPKDAKKAEEGQQNSVAPFEDFGTLRENQEDHKSMMVFTEDDFLFDGQEAS